MCKKSALVVGDVVQLVTGYGPEMTVVTILDIKFTNRETVEVAWFRYDMELRTANFPVEVLTKVEPSVPLSSMPVPSIANGIQLAGRAVPHS